LESSSRFLTQKELDPDAVAFNSQNNRYHFPARFYLPFRATWGQRDPLVLLLDLLNFQTPLSCYTYVGGRPTETVDPLGLMSPAPDGFDDYWTWAKKFAKQFNRWPSVEEWKKAYEDWKWNSAFYAAILRSQFQLLSKFWLVPVKLAPPPPLPPVMGILGVAVATSVLMKGATVVTPAPLRQSATALE
jgi:hypothetical protein